jgi:hypothetical protein
MSSTIDASWVQVDPESPLVPVVLKLPPALERKLITLSATEAIYMVKAPGTDALLQLGFDRVQSADDFSAQIKSQGGTTAIESRAGKLAGKDATEACGTLEVPLPFAVVQSGSGSVQEVPEHVQKARYGGYFVKLGDRVFRATYRIPEKEAAQWEPVFQTILGSLTWK